LGVPAGNAQTGTITFQEGVAGYVLIGFFSGVGAADPAERALCRVA